jgi:hypothetical protein
MPQIEIGEPERRRLPRRFSFHWGEGYIVEEASVKCTIHADGKVHSWEPTIQLLQYDDETTEVRFCVYIGKKFTRMPPIMDSQAMEALSKKLKSTVLLKKAMRQLLG